MHKYKYIHVFPNMSSLTTAVFAFPGVQSRDLVVLPTPPSPEFWACANREPTARTKQHNQWCKPRAYTTVRITYSIALTVAPYFVRPQGHVPLDCQWAAPDPCHLDAIEQVVAHVVLVRFCLLLPIQLPGSSICDHVVEGLRVGGPPRIGQPFRRGGWLRSWLSL